MEVPARASSSVGGGWPEAMGDRGDCLSDWAVVLQLLPPDERCEVSVGVVHFLRSDLDQGLLQRE
jgi:hypothetical protein